MGKDWKLLNCLCLNIIKSAIKSGNNSIINVMSLAQILSSVVSSIHLSTSSLQYSSVTNIGKKWLWKMDGFIYKWSISSSLHCLLCSLILLGLRMRMIWLIGLCHSSSQTNIWMTTINPTLWLVPLCNTALKHQLFYQAGSIVSFGSVL